MRSKKTLLKLFLFLILLAGFGIKPIKIFGQNQMTALAKEFTDSLNFNGNILVQKFDNNLFDYSSGYADYQHNVRIDNETKFRIASVSKAFVAYVAYILVDEGRMGFDDRIFTYIPELNSKFTLITIDDLITHQSGLIRDVKVISNKSSLDYVSEDELLDLINKTDLQFEPGSEYSYSNTGFTLLSIIISRVLGEELNEAMSSTLFYRLGMNNTGHEVFHDVIQDLASGYYKLNKVTLNAQYEDKSWVYGAGSFYSTSGDLLKFANEVIKGSLLSPELHERFLKDNGSFKTGGGGTTWPYKAQISGAPNNGQVVYYGGSSPGFRSALIMFLEHETVVIALSNQTPIEMGQIYNKMGNLALGLGKEKVFEPHMNKILYKILEAEHSEAVEIYENEKNRNPDNPELRATDINSLGYTYLQLYQMDNAIQLFTFGTLLFPDNANLYDSLGEAHFKNDEYHKSKSSYLNSLEINPDNEGARLMLRRINKILSK